MSSHVEHSVKKHKATMSQTAEMQYNLITITTEKYIMKSKTGVIIHNKCLSERTFFYKCRQALFNQLTSVGHFKKTSLMSQFKDIAYSANTYNILHDF